MTMPNPSIQPIRHAPMRRAGFTLIELLVVITVIGVLASIVLVAASGVLGTARNASAQRQLRAITQGIQQFESDLGKLPPLLTRRSGEDLFTIPEAEQNPSAAFRRLREARYHSIYTLGVYLLGTGDLDGSDLAKQTGTNTDSDDGAAGPGFRDPGPDFSWGGAQDRTVHADEDTAIRTGRVFGPYLDMGTMDDAIQLDRETGLYVILDPWGQPVRYYKDWPVVDPDQGGVRSVDRVPVELRAAGAVEKHIAEGEPDLSLEGSVLRSRYMLLSAGEPIRVNSDGSPVALYGDADEGGSVFQDPDSFEAGASFDPSSLNDDDQRWLLERLGSNIRVAPS